MKILRILKGLIKTLPVIGEFTNNIQSNLPEKGKVDWYRFAGQILSYLVQLYVIYLIAKGLINPEDLKQIFKALD
jgi:hypothetical protein